MNLPALFALSLMFASTLHAADAIRDATPQEIETIRNGMVKQLLDPTSAEFKFVKEQGGLVCGQVNAKNAMGGYVGFEYFMAALPDEVTPSAQAIVVNLDRPGSTLAEDGCRKQGMASD